MSSAAGLTTDQVKQIFLIALRAKIGNISRACVAVGISRQTYYNWMEQDEEFEAQVQMIKLDEVETMLDEAEEVLKGEILLKRDKQASQWMLTKKGRERGYGDKVDVVVTRDNFKDLEYPEEPPDIEEWEKMKAAEEAKLLEDKIDVGEGNSAAEEESDEADTHNPAS